VPAKLVERRRREGEATPEERKLGVRRLDNVGKLWAETRLVGVQATVASYRRGACLPDAAPGPGNVYSRRDAGGGGRGEPVTCSPIVNALAHAGPFQDACNLLEKFPMYLAMRRMLFYKALSSGTEDGRDES
jgi:hypothetical protein